MSTSPAAKNGGATGGASSKEGASSKAVKEYLGICAECKQAFHSRHYAMPCAFCNKNYHHQCLNKSKTASERNEEMLNGIKSISGNIICRRCESKAQAALAESKVIHQQMEKLTKRVRAQENEMEKVQNEAQQQIAFLEQQAQQAQAQPVVNPDSMMADFQELRSSHEATKQQMDKKYNDLLTKYNRDKDAAQMTINEKASLAAQAIAQYNHVQEAVTRLTAENCSLKQTIETGQHMEVDHPADNALLTNEHHHIYARFEELMNAQQKRLTDMMLQTIAPIKQLIVETVDSRMATHMSSTVSQSMPDQHAIMTQSEPGSQHQSLLKATDSTFAEALYTSDGKSIS